MYKFLLFILALISAFSKIDAQCDLQLLNCNASEQTCDLTINDPQYWNEITWWDPALLSHDLAETKVDLSLVVKDTCAGGPLSVRCLLFFDLDGNGADETVVDSDNPPPAGMVNYNNIANPNYSGGVPHYFDQRPVPDLQKWRFVLNNTVSGDTSTFRFQWVSNAAPTVFESPELSYALHKVRWVVTNSVGVTKTCEKSTLVKDCKKPTIVCLNGLSVNVMPTQMIQLWASDFLQYGEDNVTPTPQIKYSIRKSGTGTGFPVDGNGDPVPSVIFTCAELGTQSVELWALDVAGNADYCETYVIVQDNLNNCMIEPPIIKACITNACGLGADETVFNFVVVAPNLPPFGYFETGICASISQTLPANTEVTILPENDNNYLNGVSSYDLVLIQKHIDGVNLFDSPYQWIAADANSDHVIDTLDILECKKLILGIYQELPANTSWRFVDKSYVFPSPDPLSAPFPESITVNTSNLPPLNPEFIGVKICDVTCVNLVGFYDLEPGNEHLIGTPEPNPTNAGAMLPLQLVSAETVLLEVMDFSGRLLFHSETALPEGAALLEIPAAALPSAGVFVWRARVGEVVKSGKILRY